MAGPASTAPGSRLWVRCASSAFLHVRATSGATGRIQRYPLLLGRCRTGQEPADTLDTDILGTGVVLLGERSMYPVVSRTMIPTMPTGTPRYVGR